MRIAKSTAISVTGRARGAMRGQFRDIVGRARRPERAGADVVNALSNRSF